MSRGYLYAASGQKFIKEAIDSACSIRAIHPSANITLVTNEGETCDTKELFNNIIRIAPHSHLEDDKLRGHVLKIRALIHTPYDHTFFLDTDTYMAHDSEELFELLEWFDLLICHDYHENRVPIIDNRKLLGYRPYNTGVLVYNSTPEVFSFFEEWQELFISHYNLHHGDQPPFMEALLNHKLKTYSLQTIYNFRFPQFLTISNGSVKIIHGRHPHMDKLERSLNSNLGHRVWNPRKWKCESWSDKAGLIEKIAATKARVLNAWRT